MSDLPIAYRKLRATGCDLDLDTVRRGVHQAQQDEERHRPEKENLMSTTMIPANSQRDYYAQLRESGEDHKSAVAEVARSYRRTKGEVEAAVASVPPEEQTVEVEPEPEPTPAPDPLEVRLRDLGACIEELRGKLGDASLAALHDPENADTRAESDRIERELADAHAEVERITLAREAGERRAVEAAREEERTTRAAALNEAVKLQKRREGAAAEVDAAAEKYAATLRRYLDVCGAQADALGAAGRASRRQVMPPPAILESSLLGAFARAGTEIPFEAGAQVIARARSLASSDPRLI